VLKNLDFPSTIQLTWAERKLAHVVGSLRRLENRAVGIHDRRVQENAAGEDIDKQGIAAELAFARAANVYPDLSTTPRAGGVDCVTVDIKSTPRADGNLIAPVYKDTENHADIAVLVTGVLPLTTEEKDDLDTPAEFTLIGWTWMKELLRPSNIRQLRTPTYFVDRGRLFTTLPLHEKPAPHKMLVEDDLSDIGEILAGWD